MSSPIAAYSACPGLLLTAERPALRPGILLLQEIFGLNASIREVAEDFRGQGYDVFAPDLFWRQEPGVQLDPTTDRPRAEALMKGLSDEEALADMAASVRRLRGLPAATGQVAAVGYCLGGRLAFLAAAEGLVDAAVSYYGTGVHRALELAPKVDVPLLMHIAEQDHLCDAKAQQRLRTVLGVKDNVELLFHPGVGHAFARPNSPMWVEDVARRANAATADFLSTVLGRESLQS
jgi:carboxymethylenebutenolidase